MTTKLSAEGKELLLALTERFVEVTKAEQINCFNCEHCDIQGNICRLFGSQPPLKIIIKGCDNFLVGIPF